MCIDRKGQAAFTLVEVMVSSALGLMVVTVVAMLSFFSSRSFVAMTNYTDLNMASEVVLDKMSREIARRGKSRRTPLTALPF